MKGDGDVETINDIFPKTPLIENDDFVIYGGKDLENFKVSLIEKLSLKKAGILKFFGLDNFPKVQINLFSDHDDYLQFSRLFLDINSHSVSNFAGGMVNCSYTPTSVLKLSQSILYELVHLINDQIRQSNYGKTLWLDEGLALNLSGKRSHLENNPKLFKSWYLEKIVGYSKKIPPIAYLNFGEFIDRQTNSYNGYDISYILVRYCIEHLDLPTILRDGRQIEELETHVLEDCIRYYDELFHVKDIKTSFDDVKTPQELMDYMDKFITYGWIDDQNNRYYDITSEFREKCRVGSLQQILSSHLGTCIEQAKLIKFFFDKMGIENRLFCRRKHETEKNTGCEVKMHCFVLFSLQGKWYHFEHSNAGFRGIHEYSTIEEALKSENARRDKKDIRVLTEIPDIPEGLSFEEFNRYVNSFEPFDFKSKNENTYHKK